jgi:hypothetical protein
VETPDTENLKGHFPVGFFCWIRLKNAIIRNNKTQ